MSTSETRTARTLAMQVSFGDETLRVRLSDGRELSVPLEWFPTLRDASPEQRTRWQLIGGGVGIHWPDLDEDISVEGLLQTPVRRARRKAGVGSVKSFVKNRLVHRYPIPSSCKVHYEDEDLLDTPPVGHENCDACFPLPG